MLQAYTGEISPDVNIQILPTGLHSPYISYSSNCSWENWMMYQPFPDVNIQILLTGLWPYILVVEVERNCLGDDLTFGDYFLNSHDYIMRN